MVAALQWRNCVNGCNLDWWADCDGLWTIASWHLSPLSRLSWYLSLPTFLCINRFILYSSQNAHATADLGGGGGESLRGGQVRQSQRAAVALRIWAWVLAAWALLA